MTNRSWQNVKDVEITTGDSIVGYGVTGGPMPWSIEEFINLQSAMVDDTATRVYRTDH